VQEARVAVRSGETGELLSEVALEGANPRGGFTVRGAGAFGSAGDGTAHTGVWSITTGRRERTIDLGLRPNDGFALSPRGDLAAIAHITTGESTTVSVVVRSTRDGAVLRSFELPTERATRASVVFSPDADRVAVSAGVGLTQGWLGDVHVLSLVDGARVFSITRERDAGYSALGFTSRGELVADVDRFSSDDTQVYSAAGALVRTLPGVNAQLYRDVLIDRNADKPELVRLTDLVTGAVRTIRLDFESYRFALSPSGDRVAFFGPGEHRRVEIWDARAGAR
jgi:WD40 repeat protein